MKNLLKRLVVEDQGQDVIEYALLAAGISIAVIPTVPGIGTAVNPSTPHQHRRGQHLALGDAKDVPGEAPGHSILAHVLPLVTLLVRLIRDEEGQDLIEYALLTAGSVSQALRCGRRSRRPSAWRTEPGTRGPRAYGKRLLRVDRDHG